MNNNRTLTEREEVELMLPWYETGQLTAEETQLVESHLRKDSELRRMLELIREEAAETVVANERIGMPSHETRDRLMAQIAAEGGATQKARGVISGWLKQLDLGGMSPGLALAGAVAAIVIIVQAAVITSMISGDPARDGPQLASGGDAITDTGAFALVQFQENASASAITEFLRENGFMIVDGPRPGGTFKVRISAEALAEDQQGALIESLRQKADLVAFASPTR